MLRTRSDSRPQWPLVDAALTTRTREKLVDDLLQLANSDWSAAIELDFDDPFVSAFLGRHRITTMLGVDNVSPGQASALKTRLVTIAGVQLRIEATARQVLELLAEASIETRVLKGMASAELDYPSAALRQSGDVDIALRAADFEGAVAVLKQHGYRDHHTANSSFLLKGTTLDSPHGIEVDIHTRLFQRSEMSSVIFDDPEPLSRLPSAAMSPDLRLVHAAGHFILTPPGTRRMSGLVDITRLRKHPDTSFEAAREIAAQLQVEPLVGAALRLELILSERPDLLHLLDEWATPGWLDRNTRLVPTRRLTLDHLNRFREVPRSRRISYVPTWLFPNQRQRRLFAHSMRAKSATLKTAVQSKRGTS